MVESAEPRYPIGTVVARTNVPADTIRAWERRYGVPRPARTGTNRRLYSDADISHILRLRSRQSRAIDSAPPVPRPASHPASVAAHTQPNEIVAEPVSPPAREPVSPPAREPVTPSITRSDARPSDSFAFAVACQRFDADAADRWFDDCFARTDLDRAIAAAILAIQSLTGPAAVFGREIFRARLLRLLASERPAADAPLAIVAGAPSTDEVTALASAVLLARSGWRVLSLPGASNADLAAIAATLRPAAILTAVPHG